MTPPRRRRSRHAKTPSRYIDPNTGELSAMGEAYAEERHNGDWAEDEDESPHGVDDHPGFE